MPEPSSHCSAPSLLRPIPPFSLLGSRSRRPSFVVSGELQAVTVPDLPSSHPVAPAPHLSPSLPCFLVRPSPPYPSTSTPASSAPPPPHGCSDLRHTPLPSLPRSLPPPVGQPSSLQHSLSRSPIPPILSLSSISFSTTGTLAALPPLSFITSTLPQPPAITHHRSHHHHLLPSVALTSPPSSSPPLPATVSSPSTPSPPPLTMLHSHLPTFKPPSTTAIILFKRLSTPSLLSPHSGPDPTATFTPLLTIPPSSSLLFFFRVVQNQ